MTTIHTGNRRALRRQGGPILGKRRLRGGATIHTERVGHTYFMTFFASRTEDQISELRRTPADVPYVQVPAGDLPPPGERAAMDPSDMKAMFRNPENVEIITVGEPLKKPLTPRLKRQLRAIGVDMKTLH